MSFVGRLLYVVNSVAPFEQHYKENTAANESSNFKCLLTFI